MKKIIESLLSDFFLDAFPFADAIFSKLVDIVFNVENHISDGSLFENTIIESTSTNLFFDVLFKITSGFGLAFLMLKFVKKILDIYIIGTDGDPTNSPENIIIGFVKGIVTILCFNWGYNIFVDISTDFINKILDGIGLVTIPSLMTILELFLNFGLFTLLGLLVFFICYLILIFQFIKRGLEMFILRLGVPLACVGLIDSDKGVFAPYIKLFIQNSLTVVIQLAMIKLGFGIVANGNIFFGIGAMIMGIKTPQFIQQFMIGVGGSGINMMTINQTSSMIGKISRAFKK